MSSSAIDWDQLEMIADGFASDFVEIYHEYLAEVPVLLTGLREAILANNAVQAARIAHQIKGSSANFGFTAVSQPMAELESEAKSGSLASASAHLKAVDEGFAQAKGEVRSLRQI